jgi:GNAT superfamily N-acetyltransferase
MDGKENNGVTRVRLARLDEIPRLEALVARSFRQLGAASYSRAQIESALGPAIRVDRGLLEDGTYFAAEYDGELVGCGGWSSKIATVRDVPLPSPRAEVRAMFVDPDCAGRGVGRALLRAAESAILRAGFDAAYLLATRSGLTFYERAGYRALGEHTLKLPDGAMLELTCMRRQLNG